MRALFHSEGGGTPLSPGTPLCTRAGRIPPPNNSSSIGPSLELAATISPEVPCPRRPPAKSACLEGPILEAHIGTLQGLSCPQPDPDHPARGPLGALLSSPALDVRLPNALQVLQVLSPTIPPLALLHEPAALLGRFVAPTVLFRIFRYPPHDPRWGRDTFAVGGKLSLADLLIYNKLAEVLTDAEIPRPEFPASRRYPFGNKEATEAALQDYPKVSAIIASVKADPVRAPLLLLLLLRSAAVIMISQLPCLPHADY